MSDFRELALALPSTSEQDHFGSPSFRVGGKIFAQLSSDGVEGLVKLSPESQESTLAAFPHGSRSEPHWGRYGWTRLTWRDIPPDVVADLLAQSWRTIASRRLKPIQTD